MEENWLSRTELLLSPEKTTLLKTSNVIVVGLGGVGAYAAEMMARAGVGRMTLVDDDVINMSNLNRQLLATHPNMGKPKAALMAERLRSINPEIELTILNKFLREDGILEVLKAQQYDYVIDAIDTLSPKQYLIMFSVQEKLNIISSMGAGGKRNPEKIHLADLSETYNCRLAKTLRKRLQKYGIRKGIKTIYSSELQDKNAVQLCESEEHKKSTVGTISYMPAIFGCMMAAAVIEDLIKE
ncbi:MAG: tRNA threonylcarbamoyladenosine dehydratase [Bacteroidales bacterium]|jgi:tRNA A37 threonylcarbamoyladenosine dehydratase|nr:tRNA threonylcarbamoyladenosine dehydratase [Bacteroidales bacterium]